MLNGSTTACVANMPTYSDALTTGATDYLQCCSERHTSTDCSNANIGRDCVQLTKGGMIQPCHSNDCFCIDSADQCKFDTYCTRDSACLRRLPQSEKAFCIPYSSIGNGDPLLNLADSGNRCNANATMVPYPIDESTVGLEIPSRGDGHSVCIAANSLRRLDTKHLIYNKHRQGSVLCHNGNNCATPGDIVLLKG